MKIQIDDKEFELLLSYEQIKKRIRFLGIQLNVDFENRVPVFIGVLNGSFIFLADLMKEIEIASEVTFVKAASYTGAKTSGKIDLQLDVNMNLKDRDVVLVEDIVDTGITLDHLITVIKKHHPASLSICTLLLKPKSLVKEIDPINYVGFEIPNDFVVGYGLDYKGLGRHLKDIFREVHIPTET